MSRRWCQRLPWREWHSWLQRWNNLEDEEKFKIPLASWIKIFYWNWSPLSPTQLADICQASRNCFQWGSFQRASPWHPRDPWAIRRQPIVGRPGVCEPYLKSTCFCCQFEVISQHLFIHFFWFKLKFGVEPENFGKNGRRNLILSQVSNFHEIFFLNEVVSFLNDAIFFINSSLLESEIFLFHISTE